MFHKKISKLFGIFVFYFLLFSPSANAQIIDASKKSSGDYSLNDILRTAVEITNMLLGLIGSVALLFFVAGGIVFLISAGRPDMVTKGKAMITNSVIGIIIVFLSFTIINFVFLGLGYDSKLGKWNESLPDSARVARPEESPVDTSPVSSSVFSDGWEFDTGIKNQIPDASPELVTLLNCMRSNLPANVGRISSISDNNYIGNLSACNKVPCPAGCAHSCTSCHYGGGTNIGKSYAVDIGDEENKTAIVNAINKCDTGAFVLDEGNHLHISVQACPKN